MARMVRDARMETAAARGRLRVQRKPHWRCLDPGRLHLGYRRRRADAPGRWIARVYVGLDDKGVGRYEERTIGTADDHTEADGTVVMTFGQAQAAARAQEAAPRVEAGRARTVADAVDDYLEFLRAERRSAGDAESRARVHILPALGRVPLAELTTELIDGWKNALAAAPARLRTRPGEAQRYRPAPEDDDGRRARRATVNRTLTVLKAALNRAHERGHVTSDRAWRLARPFRSADAARPGHLSVEQAQLVIAAADAPSGFRDLVEAALLTGCRYGELCALLVGDYARGKLAIRQSKSGRPRHVRLTDEGAAHFAALAAGRGAGEPMLVRGDGQPWGPSHQIRPMEAACVAAGIPAVNFHQLRHTWASLAVMDGMPLMVVATNLGHKDTRMVEKHYGHLTETYLDEAIRRHAPRFAATNNVVSLGDPRGGAA